MTLRLKTSSLGCALALTLGTAQAAAPLELKTYQADHNSFSVTSTLVSGPTQAIVVDSGFTRADALRIAANVLDSGKQLTHVLISNADPDYYFGAQTLKQLFPQAKFVAPVAVREKIQAGLDGKLAFWSPKMGANAPQALPAGSLLPEPLQEGSLSVDGQALEIRGTTGPLAHRPYVWIPSLQAIVGNVSVFGNMHVWTADTRTDTERRAWIAQLDEMKALKPRVVVPGHMQPGTALDGKSIDFTRGYLVRFETALKKGHTSADVIKSLEQAYPKLDGRASLELGAKVGKGEMSW
ncbi:MBL fold metallo-hydrolase [Comamonas composti]|uniref:MBL fold metallo-hydrolase n=1 Tax=Comamonas composti TaxID=408558 RepID=UPI00041D5FA1|nr:MBL fold metallo-hydrolase [Comamonas composti]